MSLPTRIQQGAFGTRDAAPAGGTIVAGRQLTPRPALTQRGSAQQLERFITKKGELDPFAVTRALNEAQRNIADSTAAARANPTATGHLFQGVKLQGPLLAGTSSQAPNRSDARIGQQFFDTTLVIPLFFNNNNWNTASGPVQYAAAAGNPTYTIIEHGFGVAAAGVLITSVKGGVVAGPPKLVPAGDSTDLQRVRFWMPILPDGGSTLTADVYVFY